MKLENFDTFRQLLMTENQGNKITPTPPLYSPLYLIIGTDEFERKEASDHLINQLLKNKATEYSLQKYDGRKLDINLIIDELQTYGLFSKKRIIMISRAEELSASALKKLESYFSLFSTLPNQNDIHLIISMEKINRASKFYKLAVEHGIVLDFPDEKPWVREKTLVTKVTQWLIKENKTIEPLACQNLVRASDGNQGTLFQDLEKIICYIGERTKITEADVRLLCSGTKSENTFELGDAILAKNVSSALIIGNQLLNQGEVLFGLLRHIRSHFQSRYQICSMITSGRTPQDIQTLFPYMKGSILEKNINLSVGYGISRFQKGLIEIDQMELTTKTIYLPQEILLEKLIMKLSV